MRILGVDPGSLTTGYGVIERTRRGIAYVECGVIVPRRTLVLAERLGELALELAAVLAELGPEVVAVENVFSATHARAALVLGHARGVILATAAQAGLRVFEYPPATVKRAVAGSGRASKPQVSAMVRAACGLRRAPRPDATDALAVALCHAYTGAR